MQRDRKREHKKLVRFIRTTNKSLSNDEYIRNRFRVDMFNETWYRFSDGSGGELTVLIKFTDKWTRNTAYFYVTNFSYVLQIRRQLNDFIHRCAHGHYGHYPPLQYVAYDIHKIVSYEGHVKAEQDKVINKYNITDYNLL